MINFRFMQKNFFVIFHPHDRNRQLSRIGNRRNSTHFVGSLHISLDIFFKSDHIKIFKVGENAFDTIKVS